MGGAAAAYSDGNLISYTKIFMGQYTLTTEAARGKHGTSSSNTVGRQSQQDTYQKINATDDAKY
jgi:hypothetical protein